MSRCTSPRYPDPTVSTQTTCAQLQGEGVVPSEPSNCVCPDTILDFPVGNFEFAYDRFWYAGAPGPQAQKNYIVALQVNKDGFQYDQVFTHSEGECYTGRLFRIEVQVLNLPARRRITAVQFDTQGNLIATLFDVDMSGTFGDGNPHWVIIVGYDGGGGRFGYRVRVDDTQIGEADVPIGDLSNFVKLNVSSNFPGQSLPFGMWQYQQSIEDCLSSGQYNGFGGCDLLPQDKALRWDRNATDLNIAMFNAERVIVPLVGNPTQRTAYLIHPKMSGRVYWEMDRGNDVGCRGTGFWYGCAEPQVNLGSSYPGQVAGSWGLGDNGQLLSEGTELANNLASDIAIRNMFAYDVQERRLWIGKEVSPGVRQWIGPGNNEPGEGDNWWELFPTVRDLRIVFSFFESVGSVYVRSSAESCQFPAPTNFGYLT